MDSNHIIQSFWMGKLTTMEKMCIRSFMANGHEFHLYSYGKLDGVPEGCIEKDANEIMPEARVRQMPCVQQSADFFRVTMLLKKGGWWADLDTICLRPFDFTTEYVFAGCDWDTTLVQNCVIKVPAGSPIMQEWHRRIDTLSAAQVSRLKFQGIGPELCAQLVSQFGLRHYILPRQLFDPIHFDRVHRIVDPSATWDLTKSYSMHLFHAAWKGQHEADKRRDYALLTGTDDKFPEGCLYEQLKRRYLRMPKVSIVITTKDRATLLGVTLRSIKDQAFKDYEIIVVDDGTDAETPALCREFSTEYIHVGREGVYRNPAQPINIGLRRATGDVVILQNAECKHVDPATIEKLLLQTSDNNVVFALVMDLDPTGKETGIYYCGKLVKRPFFFCGAMKRSWFMKLRGMDEDYAATPGYDDNDFADRLKHEGVNIEYSDIVVHHQWHARPKIDHTYAAAARIYEAKKAAMAAGRISAVRNIGREWGALEPIDLSSIATLESSPPAIRTSQRVYRYANDGLTVDWHDRHRVIRRNS